MTCLLCLELFFKWRWQENGRIQVAITHIFWFMSHRCLALLRQKLRPLFSWCKCLTKLQSQRQMLWSFDTALRAKVLVQSISIFLQYKNYLPTSFDLLFMTVSDSAPVTPAVVGNKEWALSQFDSTHFQYWSCWRIESGLPYFHFFGSKKLLSLTCAMYNIHTSCVFVWVEVNEESKMALNYFQFASIGFSVIVLATWRWINCRNCTRLRLQVSAKHQSWAESKLRAWDL